MAESEDTQIDSASRQDKAIRLLAERNLHQCLWIPRTEAHDKLRVTFSTTRNFDDRSLPVILFVAPMFATRWFAVAFNKTADAFGVRIIFVDRPGFGGSSPVPADQRISLWLETVPLLLQKLDVKHVTLVAHSAGTIYCLNTLYHHRDILDPKRPYMALFGPWVHNEHSKAKLMVLASSLPSGMVRSWDGLNRFIGQKVMPMTSWSGGLFSSVATLFQGEPGVADSGETKAQEKYGVDKKTADLLEKTQMKYFFAESTDGVNEEALLCLKKSGDDAWGACPDYPKYVREVAEREKERLAAAGPDATKLKVDIWFAESDIMIGKGGQKFMEEAWHQEGVADSVELSTYEREDTNHESVILDFEKGGLRNVLEIVSGKHKL